MLRQVRERFDALMSDQEEYLFSWTHGTEPLQADSTATPPEDVPRGPEVLRG